jgi:hypothetical protein
VHHVFSALVQAGVCTKLQPEAELPTWASDCTDACQTIGGGGCQQVRAGPPGPSPHICTCVSTGGKDVNCMVVCRLCHQLEQLACQDTVLPGVRASLIAIHSNINIVTDRCYHQHHTRSKLPLSTTHHMYRSAYYTEVHDLYVPPLPPPPCRMCTCMTAECMYSCSKPLMQHAHAAPSCTKHQSGETHVQRQHSRGLMSMA